MSSETIDYVNQLEDLIQAYMIAEEDGDDNEQMSLLNMIDGMIQLLINKGGGFVRLIDNLKARAAACDAEVDYYTKQATAMRVRANSLRGRVKWILEERIRPIIISTGKPIEIDGHMVRIVRAAPSYSKPETTEVLRGFPEDPVMSEFIFTPPAEMAWQKAAQRYADLYKIIMVNEGGEPGEGGTEEQRRVFARLGEYIERKQSDYVRVY